MTSFQATKLLKECAVSSLSEKTTDRNHNNKNNTFSPLMKLNSIEDVLKCIDYVDKTYKDKIKDCSTKGIGYILSVDSLSLGHPINLFATLYMLLIAEANVYVLYDASYDYNNYQSEEYFLESFITKYKGAEKITIIPTLRRLEYIAIDNLIKTHPEIHHFIQLGDFSNFLEEKIINVIKKTGLRLHFPSAHYIIFNYSKEK